MSSLPAFAPFEGIDARLTEMFASAPLLVAIAVAVVLGLRHASDPDHLVAVTSLLATRDGNLRGAVRIGAYWGAGHALTLVVIGLPLIIFKSSLPNWLEEGAEFGVGLIIITLAARVCWKWSRGEYRVRDHRHPAAPGAESHRHLHESEGHDHGRDRRRTPRQAFAIGVLHGLAGTGAVVVLLIAALPGRLEAAAALAVFAPMSIVSMAALTGAFAWVLTRPIVEPLYREFLIPAIGTFGLVFGLWYAGFV